MEVGGTLTKHVFYSCTNRVNIASLNLVKISQTFFVGPVTYTNAKGETVLYGIVSGAGVSENFKENLCASAILTGRVAEPGILKWIKRNIEKFM